MHFLEIINLPFGKKTPYIALYFTTFKKNCGLIISKKLRSYPQFSFWIPIALICLSADLGPVV